MISQNRGRRRGRSGCGSPMTPTTSITSSSPLTRS